MEQMNILIANDDGPEAEGLGALRSAAQTAYPGATVVILSPKTPLGGQGLSVTPKPLDEFTVEEVACQFYIADAKPADLMYLGLGQPERFLKQGRFDLVLTGINHGENIGMDVFHSGTVGMAMLASTFFGTPAVAFSQQGNNKTMDDRQFKDRSDFIVRFLRSEPKSTARCWNVNFPATDPVGWKICSVANHSRFRPFKAEKRKHEGCDVIGLEGGFIVLSPLCLNVGPPASRSSRTTVDALHWACDLDRIRLVRFGEIGQANQYPR